MTSEFAADKVVFVGPLPEKEKGGVDAVLECLAGALEKAGVGVSTCQFPFTISQEGRIFHFHGSWQPHHVPIYRHCITNKIPYIVSPHGMLAGWRLRQKWWKKLPYLLLVEYKQLSRASRILVTSELEKKQILRLLPRGNVPILPLGLTGIAKPDYLEARKRLGWRCDEKIVLFLSRLSPEKGIELLLEALNGLVFSGSIRTRLVIVGAGDQGYESKLKHYCLVHRDTLPQIEWVGTIQGNQRWDYFQGADLFCLPSHSENFGLAILEACQVGTPVITTTATPWAHLNDLGFGAIIERSVENLRSALTMFLTKVAWSNVKRDSLAEWTWLTYGWEGIVEQYKKLYQEITLERSRDD